jgi:DNA-binding FrmR family transcriptional regulator
VPAGLTAEPLPQAPPPAARALAEALVDHERRARSPEPNDARPIPCTAGSAKAEKTMHVQSEEERLRIRKRLNRIEGQVRGVNRMLDEDRDCREVVQQLSAVRAAVHQTGLELMRVYAEKCLHDPETGETDSEVVDYLVTTLGRWS